MKFIEAKNYTKHPSRSINLIVVHTPECQERSESAENVAHYLSKNNPNAPRASAHVVSDSDSDVRMVEDHDEAWHASDVNFRSLGIEICGTAAQTAEQWRDVYSLAALERAAKVCADWCREYNIPVTYVQGPELKNNAPGFTGHVDVNKAYNHVGGHWDPGPNFPWEYFLERVQALLDVPPSVAVAPVPTCDWIRVVDATGQAWDVSPRMVGPVGIGEAVAIVKSKGYDLPTPELSDAIFYSADLRLEPMPRTFKTWTAQEMASPEVLANQRARIESAIADRPYNLVSGEYKDVVQKNGQIGLYGWHLPSGQPVQPFFPKHSPAWKDYSQGLRLARKVTP